MILSGNLTKLPASGSGNPGRGWLFVNTKTVTSFNKAISQLLKEFLWSLQFKKDVWYWTCLQ